MFQFRRLAFRLSSEWYVFNVPGCPIRKSADVTLVCSSPQLIAAYHVLHRLSDPRHPPCALIRFKKIEIVVMLPPLLKLDTLVRSLFPICQRTLFNLKIWRCLNLKIENILLKKNLQINLASSQSQPLRHYRMFKNFIFKFSNQSIFKFDFVEDIGFEPMTLSLQS